MFHKHLDQNIEPLQRQYSQLKIFLYHLKRKREQLSQEKNTPTNSQNQHKQPLFLLRVVKRVHLEEILEQGIQSLEYFHNLFQIDQQFQYFLFYIIIFIPAIFHQHCFNFLIKGNYILFDNMNKSFMIEKKESFSFPLHCKSMNFSEKEWEENIEAPFPNIFKREREYFYDRDQMEMNDEDSVQFYEEKQTSKASRPFQLQNQLGEEWLNQSIAQKGNKKFIEFNQISEVKVLKETLGIENKENYSFTSSSKILKRKETKKIQQNEQKKEENVDKRTDLLLTIVLLAFLCVIAFTIDSEFLQIIVLLILLLNLKRKKFTFSMQVSIGE